MLSVYILRPSAASIFGGPLAEEGDGVKAFEGGRGQSVDNQPPSP